MDDTRRAHSLFDLLLDASSAAARVKVEAVRPPWPKNPFPKGIRPGSATDRVLALLRSEAPRHLEHREIKTLLQLSRGQTVLGLHYLEAHGLIQRIYDPRHPHYCRLRVTY